MSTRAQCPHCPRVVMIRDDGRLCMHGSMHDPCRGSGRDTTGWRETTTPEGVVLVALTAEETR